MSHYIIFRFQNKCSQFERISCGIKMLNQNSVKMMSLLYKFGYFVFLLPCIVEVGGGGHLETKLIHCLRKNQKYRYFLHKVISTIHFLSKFGFIFIILTSNWNLGFEAILQSMFLCSIQLLVLPAMYHAYFQGFVIEAYRNKLMTLNKLQRKFCTFNILVTIFQ